MYSFTNIKENLLSFKGIILAFATNTYAFIAANNLDVFFDEATRRAGQFTIWISAFTGLAICIIHWGKAIVIVRKFIAYLNQKRKG